jgi:uncharacterized protein YgiB involved in biofilm formation
MRRDEQPRMKRSRRAALLLMGAAPVVLTACDGTEEREAAYTSIEACEKDTGKRYECEAAEAKAREQHERDAPSFATQAECVAEFGDDRCQERRTATGAGWIPFMTGFFIARSMRGTTQMSSDYAPLYRRRDGSLARGLVASREEESEPSHSHGGRYARVSTPPDHSTTVRRSGFGHSSRSWGG